MAWHGLCVRHIAEQRNRPAPDRQLGLQLGDPSPGFAAGHWAVAPRAQAVHPRRRSELPNNHFQNTPVGWARHFGQQPVTDLLAPVIDAPDLPLSDDDRARELVQPQAATGR
jgi:hypothetical protein